MDIEIRDLRKSFGGRIAVDIPYLKLSEGETIGLVGNNGAGKTTLFRLMLDLLKADGGSVTLGDTDPSKSEEWKKRVGAYIDESFLIDFLTPEEYFGFVGRISGMGEGEISAALEPFASFMAGEILSQNKLIRDLSAGNKQKTGIIAALLPSPETVILDEPFNFLDPSGQNALKRLLSDYARSRRATVIVSSHNLQHTADISSRVLLMDRGEIVRDLSGTPAFLRTELEDYFSGGQSPGR